MKRFAALFAELDASTATLAKVDALKRYFAAAAPRDAAWAVYFLAGGKPRQVVPSGVLWAIACRARRHRRLAVRRVLPGGRRLRRDDRARAAAAGATRATSASPSGSRSACCRCAAWRPRSRPRASPRTGTSSTRAGRFLLNKLIGGGFRVGVSKLLVQRALAEGARRRRQARRAAHDGLHRRPRRAERRRATCSSPRARDVGPLDVGQPYPFFLAHQLDAPLERVRDPARPRRRTGSSNGSTTASARRWSSAPAQVWIWSRGEELVTERFPEIVALAQRAARRHRARRRDRRLEGRPGRAVHPAAAAHRPQDADEEGARRRAGRLHRLRPARAGRASTCASGRSASGARCSKRAASPRSRRCRAVAGRDAAPSWDALAALRARVARARRRGLHAQAPRRRATAPAGASRTTSPPAPGGSGRSIRSASTACSSTRRPATAGAPASTPTTPSRSGTARRAMPPRPTRRSRRSPAASRRPPSALQLVPSPRPIRASPTRSSRVDRVIRAHDAREVRPGAQRQADAGVRARLRRHQPQRAPQERHRGALPAHAAHPRRQAAARGRHAGVRSRRCWRCSTGPHRTHRSQASKSDAE